MGPFIIILSHIGCTIVAWTGLSIGAIAWLIFLYLIRMFATTGIYHRLLTHKSYQASDLFLRIGCIVAASSGQMGPSWWKAHHLEHHLHPDQELDPHSPHRPMSGVRGFFFSQAGWLLTSRFFPSKLPADVESDWALRAIDRVHFIPTILLGLTSYWIGGFQYLAAFFISTTLLFHGVATVNSVTHLWGTQPFITTDKSRNNPFVALICLGEGWHNLHHAIPYSCRHGFNVENNEVRQLIDPTYSIIRFLEYFNITRRLRLPSGDDILKHSRCSKLQSTQPDDREWNIAPGISDQSLYVESAQAPQSRCDHQMNQI